VDSVPGKRKTDPEQTNRVSRAGRDDELAVDAFDLRPHLRIEDIDWIRADDFHATRAARPLLLVLGDRAVKQPDRLSVAADGPNRLVGEIYFDLSRADFGCIAADIWNREAVAQLQTVEPARRIQSRQQCKRAVAAFGDEARERFVAEPRGL